MTKEENRGRPHRFTDEERAEIEDLYFRQRAPNGRAYSCAMIAKLYGCSPSTILNVIKKRGTYADS